MRRLLSIAAMLAALGAGLAPGGAASAHDRDGRWAGRPESGWNPRAWSERYRGGPRGHASWRGGWDRGQGFADERRRDEDRRDERRRPALREESPYPPAARPAQRGGYLPDRFRGGVIEDYQRYRLRPPPRGYAWVRVNGGFALVSTEDGRIFDVIPD